MRPGRVRAARDEDAPKIRSNVPKAVQAIFERPVIEECLGPQPGGAIPADSTKAPVEERSGHETLVR